MAFDLNRTPSIATTDLSEHSDKDTKYKAEDQSSSDSSIELADESAVDLAHEIENKLEVGSSFEDIDQVYLLYCEYARLLGFGVRKGSQRYFEKSLEVKMKVYNCSCEGVPDNKRSDGRLPVYKKQSTRTQCKARIRVLRERRGPWVVSVFEKVHNHELLNPNQSYLLRSARNISHAKQSILEALHAAGIPITRACKFMEKESGGRQNVGFTRSDAYIHMRRMKSNARIDNGDSKALLEFFNDLKNKEPFFFTKIQIDEDGKLVNFFFRDARAAIDYEYFGDVLSFDTTYKTNKYNMVCAPFVGVNHHLQNVMFGLAFLSDESTETFEWLFGVFLEAMHGKEPEVIFSDQCQALMNGVDYTFQNAAHRLCQWHINQNATAHFGELNGDKESISLWHHCMNGCETEDEFEESWQRMVTTYKLAGITWFNNMYNLRRRWCSAFTNDRFCAGLHATSRSEATNRTLKDLGKRSNTLFEFVLRYMDIQQEWRARESAEDALCRGMPGQFVPGNPLLTHAAKVLTRNVFKILEHEATQTISIKIIRHPEDYDSNELEFEVSSYLSPERVRTVFFNKTTLNSRCTCRMWECRGVFCRHILKILFLLEIEEIPEQYILRRLRRDCKQRCRPSGSDARMHTGSHEGSVFVHHMMRMVYDIVYDSKANASNRSRIHAAMTKLRDDLLRDPTPPRRRTCDLGDPALNSIKNPDVVERHRRKNDRQKGRRSKRNKASKSDGNAKKEKYDVACSIGPSNQTGDEYYPWEGPGTQNSVQGPTNEGSGFHFENSLQMGNSSLPNAWI